ncbi:hypothetical protein M758_UG296900 [Ceratodon purpureus]|nr:hypothetical protein M758_UG296900 [Ceratodon purpureus]
MWAYGNHYRCLLDDESVSYETFDSGVFVMFPQGCRASPQDRNVVAAELPYIGLVKKIVSVHYAAKSRTILKCSWIRPNLARNPTVRQDEHGFWLVKYGSRQDPVRDNLFVFPYSVSQVFFVNDPEDHEWKVVLEKQPQSRRMSQEDDDVHRPDAAEHVLDARGLATPVTDDYKDIREPSSSRGPRRRAAEMYFEETGKYDGENVAKAELHAASMNREADNDEVGWLEEDFEDDDDNLPFHGDADVGEYPVYNGN